MSDLSFPKSLPGFQKMFPDDGACGAYLEKIRWPEAFDCPHVSYDEHPSSQREVRRQRSLQRDEDGADKTGLVSGVFPPHLIAIRFRKAPREYSNLILRLCPWCGAKLSQGTAR